MRRRRCGYRTGFSRASRNPWPGPASNGPSARPNEMSPDRRRAMRTVRLIVCACALGLLVAAGGPAAAQGDSVQEMTAKVRRALARVPYYGVFDLVAFK